MASAMGVDSTPIVLPEFSTKMKKKKCIIAMAVESSYKPAKESEAMNRDVILKVM